MLVKGAQMTKIIVIIGRISEWSFLSLLIYLDYG